MFIIGTFLIAIMYLGAVSMIFGLTMGLCKLLFGKQIDKYLERYED